MKKALLIVLALMPFLSFGQTDSLTLPFKEGKVIYERVVETPATAKDVLYTSAKRWLAESFKDSKSVIQSEDKEAGEILGSGNTTVLLGQDDIFIYMKNFQFNLMVNVKDGKYRIRFYDIVWNAGSSPYQIQHKIEEIDKMTKNINNLNRRQSERRERDINAINNHFYALIENFKTSLSKSKDDTF